jgi:hypothetical protein
MYKLIMYDLAHKVLLFDEVPVGHLTRYEASDAMPLVFDSRENNIVKKNGYEDILVPMTTDDVNWDDALIKILIESVDESDTIRNVSAESLDNHFAWLDVASFFEENNLLCTQVVVHPSRATEMPNLDVHESELCPENKAFFLPPPQFLGVLATRKGKQEFGMSVINSQFVVCLNFL